MPRRGAVALLLTTAALALLLSFKTPSDATPDDRATGVAGGATPRRRRPAAAASPAPGTPAAGPAAPGPRLQRRARRHRRAGRRRRPVATARSTGAVVDTRWGARPGPGHDRRRRDHRRRRRSSSRTATGTRPTSASGWSPCCGARRSPSRAPSIDVVSGATYTSLAYAQSLQAALDAARA